MGGLLLPLLVLFTIWALSRATARIQANYPIAGPPTGHAGTGSQSTAPGQTPPVARHPSWPGHGRPTRPPPHSRRPRTGMTHPESPSHEREFVSDAIVGWKAAYIVEVGSELRFTGIGIGRRYESAGVATCVVDASHEPPHPGCGCGFYVLRHRADALKMMTTSIFQGRPRTPVLLEVELTGRVEEYDRGWVGECQTVLGVSIPSSCVGCVGEPTATGLVVDDGHLVAKCEEHAEGEAISLGALAGRLGTEASWTISPLDPRMNLLSASAPQPRPSRARLTTTSLDELLPKVSAGDPAAFAAAKLAIIRKESLGEDDWIVTARRLWDALPQAERLHVVRLAPPDHPIWDHLLRG
jgi:hypothetical protein